MSVDWRPLLARVLDGEELDEAEARALAEALDKPPTRRKAMSWLSFEAQLRGGLAPGSDVALSRERLLAKAALREKRRQVAAAARRRHVVRLGLTAVAAVLVVAVLGALLARERYPRPRAEGDFQLLRAEGPVVPTSRLERGDRLLAGAGGASLALGGYCDLRLEPHAEVVLRGEPGREKVELDGGRLVSRITPHRGEFRVITPLGSLRVVGTEFVTTVEYPESQEGGSVVSRLTKSAMVTVMVLSGAVAYDFGGKAGLLSAGMTQAFAGDEERPGLPDGLRGFKGLLAGTLVSKGARDFVLKVEKVPMVWKESGADNPENAIGKEVAISLRPRSRTFEAQMRAFAEMEPGTQVLVEAFNLEGDRLFVMEILRTAAAPKQEVARGEGEGGGNLEADMKRWEERARQDWGEGQPRVEPRREGGDQPVIRREGEGDRKVEPKRVGGEGDRPLEPRREGEGERKIIRDGEGDRPLEPRREGEGERKIIRDGEGDRKVEPRREGEGERKVEPKRVGGDGEGDRRVEPKRVGEGERKIEPKRQGGEGEGEPRPARKEWGREDGGEGAVERKDTPARKVESTAAPIEGIQGFRGILEGTVLGKGGDAFVLRVEKVVKVWQSNEAKNPDSLVGKAVTISLRSEAGLNDRLVNALAEVKSGDRVVVAATHVKGSIMSAGDVLKKAD